MARKRANKSTNAIQDAVQSQRMRRPRLSVRGQISQNTMIQGNWSLPLLITDVNGNSGGIWRLEAKDGGYDPAGLVSTLYNEYKFLPGTTFNYIPSVGINTPGNVFIAYVTNPELITLMETVLTTSLLTFNDRVRAIGNCKVNPVWQGFSVPMDQILRRPRFDVNPTISSSADNYDRSVQGAYFISIIGSTATTTICRNSIHKKLQLYELQGTGIL